MFDDPDAVRGSERQHYAACERCHDRYSTLADDARAAAGLLEAPELEVDVASAYRVVAASPAAQPGLVRLPILPPATRPMFAGLAAAVALTALVAVAAVNVLPIFQPQTVRPVPISIADAEALSALGDYGTFTWSQQPQPQIVLSAAEAEKVSGLHAPTVG